MTTFNFSDKLALEKAISGAKTEAAIEAALSKAGFCFENVSSEFGYPNFRMETADGYVRIYRNSRKEIRIQEWKRDIDVPVAPAEEMEWVKAQAMKLVKLYAKNHEVPNFDDLSDYDRYLYVAWRTAHYFSSLGIYSWTECWSRAIDNAQAHRERGFDAFLNKFDHLDTWQEQIDYIKQCCGVTGRTASPKPA